MVNEDISLDSLDIERLNQSLHNKTRSLEIRQSYDEKMNTQIGIVKTVITICLILLAITLLYNEYFEYSSLYYIRRCRIGFIVILPSEDYLIF